MIRNSRGTLFHVAPRVWGLYPLRNPGHSKSQDKEFVRDGRFILEGKGTIFGLVGIKETAFNFSFQ